jgi:hypothetical protein
MNLIGDWGGFEKLIAALHETGNVKVEHNVTLVGESGAPRQIDVLVTHTEGLYTHRILVECKCWRSAVERLHVDAMVTAVKDLKASRGVFFTTVGYQSGAETTAKANGIELFVVRELSDDEWGGPGRVVDLYLHVVERGVGQFAFPQTTALAPPGTLPSTIAIEARLGRDGVFETSTPVIVSADAEHPEEESTLERVLMEAFDQGAALMLGAPGILQGGEPCTKSSKARVSFIINRPLVLVKAGVPITLRNFEYDMLLRTSQSRVIVDRGDNFLFSLAVVNFVTGQVHAGSRRRGELVSKLVPLAVPEPTEGAAIMKNGSVLRILAPGVQNIETLPSKPPDLVPYVYDMTRKTNLGVVVDGGDAPNRDASDGSTVP